MIVSYDPVPRRIREGGLVASIYALQWGHRKRNLFYQYPIILDPSAPYTSAPGWMLTIPGIFEESQELAAAGVLNVTWMWSELQRP